MHTAEYTRLSEDEHLALEARSTVRHEYLAGDVHATTGATLRRNHRRQRLRPYVLVAQDEAKIEIHRRHGGISWRIVTLTPGDPVELKSLEFASGFAAVYEETGLIAGV